MLVPNVSPHSEEVLDQQGLHFTPGGDFEAVGSAIPTVVTVQSLFNLTRRLRSFCVESLQIPFLIKTLFLIILK